MTSSLVGKVIDVGSKTYNLTQHTITRMTERNITPNMINEAITNGKVVSGKDPGTLLYQLGSNASSTGQGLNVVIDAISRNIITVISKGSHYNP